MSLKLKHQEQGQSNVLAMPTRCQADGCKKTTERMNLCGEHYDWFKFGLIDKSGKRPSDFDKKYDAFMRKKSA